LAIRHQKEARKLFHFLFRALGMIVLAFAVITAVLDLTRSIAASSLVMTPFWQLWSGVSASSFNNVQAVVEANLHPVVWDPVMTTLLALPGWALLWLIAMIFLWLGQKRENPYGRFASR